MLNSEREIAMNGKEMMERWSQLDSYKLIDDYQYETQRGDLYDKKDAVDLLTQSYDALVLRQGKGELHDERPWSITKWLDVSAMLLNNKARLYTKDYLTVSEQYSAGQLDGADAMTILGMDDYRALVGEGEYAATMAMKRIWSIQAMWTPAVIGYYRSTWDDGKTLWSDVDPHWWQIVESMRRAYMYAVVKYHMKETAFMYCLIVLLINREELTTTALRAVYSKLLVKELPNPALAALGCEIPKADKYILGEYKDCTDEEIAALKDEMRESVRRNAEAIDEFARKRDEIMRQWGLKK